MGMFRSTVLLTVFFLLFAASGTGITTYDIQVEGDTAYINASFELYSSSADREINYWETSWTAPANSKIISVHDTQGEITDYSFEDSTLQFRTNKGPRRTKEVIDVQLVTDNIIKNQFNGMKLLRLQLSGFSDLRNDVPDEVTQVTVETDERILSESHSYGFDYTLNDDSAVYRGEGPVNLHIAVGDGGEEYANYVLFGDANLTEADNIYWLVPAITGFVPEVNKYPVIVLSDAAYDEHVDTWSAGQYRTGGLIFLRESTTEKNELPAIVLHEVTHAYNEHALRWTNEGMAWFDEGTAKYVEYLVKHEKDVRRAEIFGDETSWTGPCKDQSGRCRYVLQPRGTPDQLWSHYESGSDMMYTWSPSSASTSGQRTFGYAFSELLVRNTVQENGAETLRNVYDMLLSSDKEKGASQKAETQSVLETMDADFTPCYEDDSPSRSRFESCLEAVNTMEPPVPSAVTVQNRTRTIDIQRIERPNVSGSVVDRIKEQATGQTDATLKDFTFDVLYAIGTFFEDLVNNIFKRE